MKQIINAAVICILALAACTTPFKKAKDGSQYKIISTKSGATLVTGNFMQMNSLAKYKDSVLTSSIEDGMPQFALYDTANFPPPFKEIFKSIHVGDSIIIKISTDSIIAKSMGQAPPFMQKGQFIIQSFTITNLYTSQQQADSVQKIYLPAAKAKDYKKQMEMASKSLAPLKSQIEKDDKIIEEYLAKNNIKASKASWGTYVAITNEGTGEKLTSNDIAIVNYTGKTFDSSKVFDSNINPEFNHVQPYTVNLSQVVPKDGNGVILGWIDALMQLKKGSKAVVYIPSSLGYGKNGRMPKIKGDDILVFDIEVVDVSNEEAMMAKQQAEQQKMMEAQQKMMDSIKNVKPGAKTK